MSNHPNRNWRARMRASADQWLTTTEAKVLVEVPLDHRYREQAMRNRIRSAYEAGYRDARKNDQP
jgi:hypothetical protein